MYLIPVGNNYAAVDEDIFNEWGDSFWCIDASGYAVKRTKGKLVRLHLLVVDVPSGLHTDHINRNRLDCRRQNLRACTPRQNTLNRAPKNKFKGVFKHGQYDKWCAQFCGKHLGVFDCAEHAALAYNEACYLDKDHEFCYLNFKIGKDSYGFAPSEEDIISSPSKGVSKFKGVTKVGNGWVARLTVDGNREYLGYFNSEVEADKAIQNRLATKRRVFI